MKDQRTPLVEMKNISISFGGIHAVDNASVDLYPGEVVALLGHNGAGKSTLIKILSGAYKRDARRDPDQWRSRPTSATRATPRNTASRRSTRRLPSPTTSMRPPTSISAASCAPPGARSTTWRWRPRPAKSWGVSTPTSSRFKEPVKALSGGQRQSVAIARAILFDARILIMDEPTAALGPQETAQVGELIKQLKREGIGIFLISHDIHDVFDLADRVSVMKNGQVVGQARTEDVTKDEVLGMIIMGKVPPKAIPGPGAMQTA